MVDFNIIQLVDEPTDWVNGPVIVEIRVFPDPQPINQTITHEHLNFPTAEKSISKILGVTHFSKLDASSGYWQIKVNKNSSNLLAFSATIGRFHFKWLRYSTLPAS